MSARIFSLPYIRTLFMSMVLCLSFSLTAEAQNKAPALPYTASATFAVNPTGGQPLIALHVTVDDGYYTYAHDGGADLPTTVTLEADGKPISARLLYPESTPHPDFFEPGKMTAAYTGTFTILLQPEQPTDAPLTLRLSMLSCSEKNCIPIRAELPLGPLPAAEGLSALPQDLLKRVQTASDSGRFTLQAPASLQDPASLSTTANASAPAAASSQKTSGLAALGNVTAPSAPEQAPVSSEWRFEPQFLQNDLEPTALGSALLLGLLAGLILNVMPCVLPVLTMKISALLMTGAHADERARIRHFREHNLLFSAGIITWFAILAILVGGLGFAWGSLFQSSGLVFGLLVLVFLLSLSLFDVFTLPVLDFKVGVSGSPRVQAYLTGLVATLLATPCSGPLLGGVLGWAALQPFVIVLAVFCATGLGMASPYLVLAAYPAASRLLPKPGAWTGIMERLVGFFLMGTTIYLLSILPESLRLGALVTLLFAGLAGWLWGQWGGLRASFQQKLVVGALALLLIGGSSWWAFRPTPPPAAWQSFSEADFRAQLGKQPLFVEFTADWCPSCKVLEHTVLTPDRLQRLTTRTGARLIRVDLTRPNPEAEALLRALGSVSIPVAALFPSGPDAGRPVVLRDLYTADQLESAFDNLLPRKN